MTPPSVVLVVPCYVEATRLVPAAFLDFLAARPAVRLLFVDDGSRDQTLSVLMGLQARRPQQVRVIHLASNVGKAEAVRRGILEAVASQPACLGYWDADLATPLDALDDFLALLEKRPDIELVLGSRVMLMGRDIRRSAARHYVARVFATGASLTLALPVYDTQCGAKVLRNAEWVPGVFGKPFRSTWIFDVELIERYLELPVLDDGPPRPARIYELALPAWHEVPGSKLRYRDFLRSILQLYGIWRQRVAVRGRGRTDPARRRP